MTEDLILALVLMAIAGGAIGFVSAMLGIGGGMLMVPALLLIIGLLEVPPDKRMHVAAGTSLCIMIATALGSVVSHARRGNVVWVIVLRVVPGIVVGVIGGSLLAHVLASHVLGVIFAVVLLLVGLLMIFGFKATPEAKKTPGFVPSTAAGSIIGFKSGLLGVGGGALSVPWLTSRGLPQNEVSGTSSCFTLPAAIVGTVAFMAHRHGFRQVATDGGLRLLARLTCCWRGVADCDFLWREVRKQGSRPSPADRLWSACDLRSDQHVLRLMIS